MKKSDYARVERALHYIAEHFKEQPSLADIAASVQLSEFHFQRLFSRWVGISPKKFLQYLTLDYAKQCLAESQTVLDSSLAAGLSGSSRLHDLFIRYECISPGEFRQRGANLSIYHDTVETVFGLCLLMATERGICGIAFIDDNAQSVFNDMARRWPEARVEKNSSKIAGYAKAIGGIGRNTNGKQAIRVALYGTPFQLKIWEALLHTEPGMRISYQQLAQAAGAPGASRAAGTAVGSNPLSWLIPCHRVIRSNGMLGKYHWGEARKLAMLGWEASQTDATKNALHAG